MLAAQLRCNPIIRLFFDGIEVTRDKDKRVRSNITALKKCISFLEQGGRLFVFPEGTSTLGPAHLPFKEGAAILASRFNFSKGRPLTVVPCAVFYDDPTHLGGKAEIVAGKPMVFTQSMQRSEIHAAFTRALEEVGIDYSSFEQQQITQQAAVLLSLSGNQSYHFFLRKIHENESYYQIVAAALSEISNSSLGKYKGIAIFPRSIIGSLWTWLITAPFVFYAFMWNLLPVCAGWYCSKKFADDVNVISLWKIIPAFTLWLLLTALEIILMPQITVLSLAVSLLGFIVYGAWKKHTVGLYNWVRHPQGMKKFNRLRAELYEKIIQ